MADVLDGVPLRRVPTQARSREKVARALVAADGLLDHDGPAALNLTRVAAAAGLSVGALHQYLPDREAIVQALAARYHGRLEQLLDDAITAQHGDDPVGTTIAAVADVYRDEAGVRVLRLGRDLTDDALGSAAHKERMAAKVRRALVARGLLPDDAGATVVARVVFLAADAVLHEAFRADAAGERALLDELTTMLRGYVRAAGSR